MALFKFRLAPVLRYREHLKEEKEWELRALLETPLRMDEEIRALERRWLSADETLARREGQVFSAVELRLHAEYGRWTAERIKERQAARAKVLEKIAEKRRELLEARRVVKSLDQLRHRSATKFQREQNSAEQKFTDEIGLRQFAGPKNGKKKSPLAETLSARRHGQFLNIRLLRECIALRGIRKIFATVCFLFIF